MTTDSKYNDVQKYGTFVTPLNIAAVHHKDTKCEGVEKESTKF
jgi:hypothetical protein